MSLKKRTNKLLPTLDYQISVGYHITIHSLGMISRNINSKHVALKVDQDQPQVNFKTSRHCSSGDLCTDIKSRIRSFLGPF